jgi:hypothetical protein
MERCPRAVTNSMAFGRRPGFGTTALRKPTAEPGKARPLGAWPAEPTTPPPPPTLPGPSVEDELLTWKRERRLQHGLRIPWRPLLLVASATFFIASFVLPSSVNSVFDWLLDLLAVGSSLAWYSGRRKDSRGSDG